VYGEWVVLSGAVIYLSTFNSGVQTYANNQMAIHYNGGELEAAKTVQASALKLTLILIATLAPASSAVLFMPIGRWLHLHYTDSRTAALTIFLLVLQLVTGWLFSLLCNSYLVLGRAHRGQNWVSAQRLVAVLATAAFLWGRASFPVLALTQLTSMVLFTMVTLADMRISAPVLLPSLRYGNAKTMLSIIRPSAYFGLYSVSGILLWLVPVLIIQLILGSTSVALFSITRMIFNFSRQILSVATFAISQEITILVGTRDWSGLRRLYDLSERMVLFLVTTISVGTLLMCPLAFSIWLHKPSFYEPGLCLLMAMVSSLAGIKDHKIQFQYSSNQHEKLAVIGVLTYLTMCGVAALTLRPFGISSLLLLWLGAELVQVAAILRLNKELFPPEIHISAAPVVRALVMLTVCFSLVAWPVYHSTERPLAMAGIALPVVATLCVISYFVFGLKEVRELVEGRWRRRLAAAK
jgi:O-antigen/teichoic acid export membrane protein